MSGRQAASSRQAGRQPCCALLGTQLALPLPCSPPLPRRDGQRMILPPVSNKRVVDFGAGIGRRSVYLYNLPEVTSGHQV